MYQAVGYLFQCYNLGTVIGTVTATDADAGDNSILTYSFASSNRFFRIDKDTGKFKYRNFSYNNQVTETCLTDLVCKE